MKRMLAVVLAVLLMVGAVCVTPVSAKTVVAKGIDVSKWQMPVDWNAVAANPDIDYAILRATWSGLETTEWATFYAGAKAAGVPIGAYAYTMAATVAEAKAEAQKTVELLKGKQFEYPIYIDTEEEDIYNNMDKATLTAIVKAECDVLRDAGYMAGVYTNTWYATSKLDMAALSEYTVWLADYSSTPGYTGDFDMWQYTYQGVVNGVSGTVDMNYCYKDFPTIIKQQGLNGYTAQPQDPNIVAKGIDVSKWQMPVDWKAVAKDPNVDYAILRVTWNGLETTEWATFYPEAKAAGVPIGCYAYIMATTLADARKEARNTVQLLKGKQFEYPIYIDVEDSVYDGMDKTTLTAIVKAECDVLKQAGYMPGVYCNTNFATNRLDMSKLSQYTLWIADYRGYCGYTGKYDMWQYSDKGSVNGISGNVDMNYCYTDFPTKIKEAGLNGYEAPAPSQPEPSQPEPSEPEPSVPEEPIVLGDADLDGEVSAKDALEVLKCSVGKVIFSEKQQKSAEVMGDDTVDAKDALEILKFAVGKIVKFPVEA